MAVLSSLMVFALTFDFHCWGGCSSSHHKQNVNFRHPLNYIKNSSFSSEGWGEKKFQQHMHAKGRSKADGHSSLVLNLGQKNLNIHVPSLGYE